MADLSIAIEILGKDSASAAFGSVGKAAGGLLGGMRDLGLSVLGIGVAFDAGKSAIEGLIGPAIEAQQVASQTAAVLKSTGGAAGLTAEDISGLAGELSKLTPFEDEAIQSAENLLLTFTGIGGDIMPAATETVLNMSQALGQDLKSSSVQLGKALNDPIKGITALSRVGVSFTDEQKDQIKVLQESGDMMGAQTIILAELEKEFGGAAKAAGQTFGGQMVILQTAVGNVAEAIGGPLVKGLSSLATAALPAVQAFADELPAAIDGFMGSLEGLGEVLSPIVTILTDSFATIQQVFAGDWSASDSIDPVVNAVGQLAGVFQQVGFLAEAFGASLDQALGGDLEGALGGMTDALSEILPNITTQLGAWATAFLSWIGPMIPPLLQQLLGVMLEVDTWIVQTGLPMLVTQLGTWAGAFVDWVAPLIPPLLGELGALLIQMSSWFLTVALPAMVTNLATWGLAFIEWVAPRIPLLIGEIQKLELALGTWILTDALPAIVAKLVEWGAAFVDWIGAEVLPKLPGALETIGAAITSWVDGAIAGIEADLSDVGAAIVLGIEGGIRDAWGHLQEFFGAQIRSLFPFAQGLIEAHSPSRLAARLIGQPIALGIAGGILEGSAPVTDAVRAIVDAAVKNGINPLHLLALAKAESGLDPTAHNTNGEDSVGLFQHNRAGGQGTGFSVEQLMDPVFSAQKFAADHAALYKQLVAEGYTAEELVRKFGLLAEVSAGDGGRYVAGLREVVAEYGDVNLAAAKVATTQTTGVVAAKTTTDAICATVSHLPECMTSAGNASSVALVGSLTSGLPMVTTAAQGILATVANVLAPMPTDVGGVAADAVRQLSAGLTQGMPAAADAATMIADAVAFELGPLPELAGALGEDLGAEMASGIRDSTKEAVRAAERMVSQVADALSGGAIDMLGGFKMPHFAGGGVVPGSGPLAAVVHGGEMILNPPQQAAIFGGGGGGGGDTIIVNVSVPGLIGSPQQLADMIESVLAQKKTRGGRLAFQ